MDPSWTCCPYCACKPASLGEAEAPVAAPAQAEPPLRLASPTPPQETVRPTAWTVAPSSAAPPAVLVVVDDPELLLNIRKTAILAGFNVCHASSAAHALRQVEALQPVGAILQGEMPGMDGYTLCDKLLSYPSTAHIPIILILPSARPDAEVRASRCRATAVLSEPLDAARLLSCLSGVFAPDTVTALAV
jgi:CheY-like chemotaxis protein